MDAKCKSLFLVFLFGRLELIVGIVGKLIVGNPTEAQGFDRTADQNFTRMVQDEIEWNNRDGDDE